MGSDFAAATLTPIFPNLSQSPPTPHPVRTFERVALHIGRFVSSPQRCACRFRFSRWPSRYSVPRPLKNIDSTHCTAAAKFLRGELHMQALVDQDTVDDWRTGKKTPGCRITSVGATDIGVNKEAVRFYERVRAAGWTRTPDPIDAPNEGALRFRWEGSDCCIT